MIPASPPLRRAAIPHVTALDGLRGLAVIGVLLYHDGRLPGGYLGVDLFFVLSGYLITALLLAEQAAAGSIDLEAFWVRRARRLFPALLALAFLVALFAARLAPKEELRRIRLDGLAALGYVANWRAIFAGQSYWDLFRSPSPFDHTWSLAIEEQFYVVWPLLAALVLRRAKVPARALLVVSLGLAAASAVALSVLYSPDDPSRAYQGTDTRGAAILLGAALGCLRPPGGAPSKSPRLLDALGLVAFAILAVAWARLDGQSPWLYRGGFWVTELCCLALIACAREGSRSLVARALSAKPLTLAGLVSYGLYLYHWPVFVVLTEERTHLAPLPLSLLRYAVTLALTVASHRLLEQPIRRRGVFFGRPIVVVPLAVAAAVGALLFSTRGAVSREELAARARAAPPADIPLESLKILVLGDSVAEALGERLHFMQDRGPTYAPFVVARGVGDCSLLHDQLPTRSLAKKVHAGGDCDARWLGDAEEVRPDITLVVLGGGFFAPAQINGEWQRPCDPGWRQAFQLELIRDLEGLRAHGGQVYVTLVPYPVGQWIDATPRAMVDCYNDAQRAAAEAVPGVRVLDVMGKLCPGGECTMRSAGALVRPDGLHFDGLGAEEIALWVLEELHPIGPQAPPM